MKEKIYRIHPCIGFARVGNADVMDHFIGPTIPVANAEHDEKNYKQQFQEKYKTKDGKVRPQAALFSIWEYEKETNKPIREIVLGLKDVEAIGWQVHLINKKADFFKFNGTDGRDFTNPEGRRNDPKKNWIMDPLPRKISGINQGGLDQFKFIKGTSSDPSKEKWIDEQKAEHQYLGELMTDGKGRLKIIGGKGIAASVLKKKIEDAFNNPGWYDDVSDGLVQASITLNGTFSKKRTIEVIPAWVMVGPPDFVPEIRQVVTLYDLLADLSVRVDRIRDHTMISNYPHLTAIRDDFKTTSGTKLSSYKPHFHDDIYPIIVNAFSSRFTHEQAYNAHGLLDITSPDIVDSLNNSTTDYKPMRSAIFTKLRLHNPYIYSTDEDTEKEVKLTEPLMDPDKNKKGKTLDLKKHASTIKMPLLFAETYGRLYEPFLTLTFTQYEMMRKWMEGDFIVSSKTTKIANPIALDIASMENAIGGGFFPGIDFSWAIKYDTNYTEPFRIDPKNKDGYAGGKSGDTITPGYFSRQMGQPWHADFTSCAKNPYTFYGFWPSQRPDDVLVGGKMMAWFRKDNPKKGVDFPDMVNKWHQLGFVRFDAATNEYIETERGSIK